MKAKKTNPVNTLLICANQIDASFYQNLFKDLGCSVSCSLSSENALALFANYQHSDHSFAIVFLEYQLFGTNGISLARKLRKIDPEILLMLLPSAVLLNESVKKEYKDFDGFTIPPTLASRELLKLINLAREKI